MRVQAAFAGKGNKALDNGVASTAGAFDNILMNGQEVFKFAVRAVPTVRAFSWRFSKCCLSNSENLVSGKSSPHRAALPACTSLARFVPTVCLTSI